ncbi:ISL3 family transposase [Butyrivibrio sp. INlla16]|uniref:ISL3 family transposase n=1 Tax=Butyrivibrio sp. INlla16 TaxID=1520807 RepID=UPI00087E9D93|nr:ISL3 family transposase [Butyrivibrio sp. INlla16]SDB67838.1 Transposase [Butyrivibrio sp. INlla16]
MTSATTLFKELLNVNDTIIDDINISKNRYDEKVLIARIHPRKGLQWKCPICGKRCKVYDQPYEERRWRGLDFGAIPVELIASVPRVICKEHGVKTAGVPWAYPDSGFTKDFEYTVVWLCKYLSRSAVSNYMRIDWRTVGRCITRVHNDIEPNVLGRLNGLVKIGIDETSYRTGHKYITVVLNHETNTVVWASDGHGKTVLEKFFNLLTPQQCASIEVVSGDGARWITDCVNEYIPNAKRCVDPFHVVEWTMEALDSVRTDAWREALAKLNKYDVKRGPGRPKADDEEAKKHRQAKKEASEIKQSSYALGKSPDHLTATQEARLEMIQKSDKRLYRAYILKEKLRLLLKITDRDEAESELIAWVKWARHCRIPAFVELQRKIMRHKDHILNTIELGVTNARIEATNNKIKLLIRKAYGFRNVDSMIDMVLLYCSGLKIPLPNRNRVRYA